MMKDHFTWNFNEYYLGRPVKPTKFSFDKIPGVKNKQDPEINQLLKEINSSKKVRTRKFVF